MINRRMLVIALGAAVLIAPFGSLAQQSRVWRVGYLAQIPLPLVPLADTLNFCVACGN